MYPNSALLRSIYIPDYFEPKEVTTEDGSLIKDKDYFFDTATDGTLSVIKINKPPFIDLSKYDFMKRQWYYIDQYEGLWRKYLPGDYVIEEDYTYSSKWMYINDPRYYSQENLGGGSYYSDAALSNNGFVLSQYSPITIKVNENKLTDITNYTGIDNIVPKLDIVNPDENKEFYFDKNFTIYTNQDLNVYETADISISYFVTIDSINVKFRMNTNTTSLNNYTPTVDYYIVSLTGQDL